MEETVSEFLTKADEVPVTSRRQTVDAVLTEIRIRSSEYETIDYVYVLDDKKLVGVLSIHELLLAESSQHIESVMNDEVAFIHLSTDLEHAGDVALAQSIKAVPVVDAEENFVGVVTADVILQYLRDSHTSDLMKIAGLTITTDTKLADYTVLQHFSSRIPWLVIGLAGGLIAAFVVEHFNTILEAHIILAAFIPALVYIADSVGSQTQMVYIRSLEQRRNSALFGALSREFTISLLIGIVLASLIFTASFFWVGEVFISLALGISVFATTLFSVLIAVLLPWLLNKVGKDPTVATGPLATVIRDVSSIAIYLVIASYFVL